MYQVIARKYRPQSFSELINQVHVKTTLENAIAQNRIAHGYIFSGQRGTGKTTVARILARCLNCVDGPAMQPCGVCSSCLEIAGNGSPDVIEIDAASNRGINEMRELRENVRYRPVRDRYKVFIVDEAHQITSEAFNALLKTLEEPPEWVIFVLCTTEAHKIPATIASRCQHFSFRSVDFEEIVGRMEWICKQEGIEAEPEALSVLALAGEGSVRDSLSALDQAIACCGNTLKTAEIRALLGSFSLDVLERITQALVDSAPARMLEVVDELVRNGHHLQHFVRELARYFRNLLVAKIAGAGSRLVAATAQERERLSVIAEQFSEQDLTRYLQITLDIFRDLQFSLQPRLHLELGLIRLIEAGRLVSIEEALAGAAGSAPASPKTGSGSAPAPPKTRSAGPYAAPPAHAAPPAPQASPAPAPESAPPQPAPAGGDLRDRLASKLVEQNLKFTADAISQSEVVEGESDIRITAPDEFGMVLKEREIEAALKALGERPRKVRITFARMQVQAAPKPRATGAAEEEAMRRALEHPEVQRFREAFPDSTVRIARNLRDQQ
ncbi:MAG TPA: DNA polymerase III subunit gamma/tau [Bryobacteraceae bacterium]|nr:DNA polymerase III subunit gamma/tau [Bryobacteraceae bacterium]